MLSHKHPYNPPTKAPTTYADFTPDPVKGASTVSVGTPHKAHVDSLKPATDEPKKLEADKLALLKEHISTYLLQSFNYLGIESHRF